MLVYIVLMLLSAWISMSLLIDMLAVPTVFRNISSLEEAGNVGMTIFKAFNSIEVGFGILLLIFGWKLILKSKSYLNYLWRFLLLTLVGMACLFRFHMTPTITKLTHEMHQYESESRPYLEVNKKHQVYHKGYVKLEGVKLILILMALVLFFYFEKRKGQTDLREEM